MSLHIPTKISTFFRFASRRRIDPNEFVSAKERTGKERISFLSFFSFALLVFGFLLIYFFIAFFSRVDL